VEHLQHFNLKDDPFRNEPLLRFFFDTRQQQHALRRMERAVRQHKGLSVLVGDVGSGKTMVVRQLLENLEEEMFEASMMVVLNGAADASWMLTRFARQLGVEEPPREREALIAEIYDRLAIVREDGRHAVLIIDDAQALASPETLSEICGLLKLEYEDRRLLSLVLAGTSGLAEAIGGDEILSHRVDVKVELAAFDAATASDYLLHRVRKAGGPDGLLDATCLAALHHFGRGIPGLMNTLADNAMFEAFLCGRESVSAMDVERAHHDLGWEVEPEAPAPQTPQIATPVPEAAPAPVAEPAPRAASEPEPVTAIDYSVPPHQPVLTPLRGASLDDLDSELEAVFETDALSLNSEQVIDLTSPEAIGSFTPTEGPPKLEEEPPEDLLVELIED
jgi:type II secretory pathway predicted ATPase ExeA